MLSDGLWFPGFLIKKLDVRCSPPFPDSPPRRFRPNLPCPNVESTQAAEELWRAIKGKGAFRFFKDTANRLGLLDQWYRYRDAAVKEYVMGWAEANQVTVEDDTRARPRNDQ